MVNLRCTTPKPLMSPWGQTSPWRHVRVESVLPPTSNIGPRCWHGSFVPKGDICDGNRGGLFDHLVGAGQKRLRDIQADRFRSLDVDSQFKLRGLINGQVSGRTIK